MNIVMAKIKLRDTVPSTDVTVHWFNGNLVFKLAVILDSTGNTCWL